MQENMKEYLTEKKAREKRLEVYTEKIQEKVLSRFSETIRQLVEERHRQKMTQYITGLDIAELDDVFGNTVGGWIGVLAAYVAIKRKGKESWTGLRCIILEDCYKIDFNLFM